MSFAVHVEDDCHLFFFMKMLSELYYKTYNHNWVTLLNVFYGVVIILANELLYI